MPIGQISAFYRVVKSSIPINLPSKARGTIKEIVPRANSENITKIDFSPYTYSVVPNTYMMSKALVLGVADLAQKKLDQIRRNCFGLRLGQIQSRNSSRSAQGSRAEAETDSHLLAPTRPNPV